MVEKALALPGMARVTWRTPLVVALLAAICEQVLHELTHGLVGIAVGKRWEALHLFASSASWPGEPSALGDGLTAGSAAVLNIACGLVLARVLARSGRLASRPVLHLFLFQLATFSLLAGFGYLMMDGLFYRPGSAGDWRKVIGLLGGGWAVRAPVLAVGSAGVLWAFFWLPKAALAFTGTGPGRFRDAAALLLWPYLAVCSLMTALSFGHPLGANGVVITALKHWMGYSALAWGAWIAASMAKKAPPEALPPPLPDRVPLAWSLLAAGAIAIALVLASPR